MNRKAKNIIIKGLLLVLVVAFVTLLIIAKAKRERLFSSNVEIKINHLNGNYFVDQQTIFNNIKRRFPVNQKIDNEYLSNLEKFLEINPQIKDVQAFIDNSGKLNVSIIQRQPILRVITKDGLNFYVDVDGNKFPTSRQYTAKVPVITGLKTEKGGKSGKINSTSLKEVLNISHFVQKDEFLSELIGQYFVDEKNEIVLIPRLGDFSIEIGDDKNLETKFKNLKIFYFEGLKNVGWETYKKINVKFEGQVICTK